MTNYKVQPGHTLILSGLPGGPLTEGKIIPEWVADRDNGLKGRLAVGCLAPTSERVNVEVAPPQAKTADDPAPGLAAECDRLTRENAEYARSNRDLAAVAGAQAAELKTLTARLGELTAENAGAGERADHLQDKVAAAADENAKLVAENATLTAEVARLTADLEAATKPEPKKGAKDKGPAS